jgi:hypothetical protein
LSAAFMVGSRQMVAKGHQDPQSRMLMARVYRWVRGQV